MNKVGSSSLQLTLNFRVLLFSGYSKIELDTDVAKLTHFVYTSDKKKVFSSLIDLNNEKSILHKARPAHLTF